MDVISLWQNGVTNAVASLGTALTENQAKLVSRYTKNVILSYDSDNAGIAATQRGLDIMSAAGIKAKVLSIDDGKDPDEYIKKYGKSDFEKLIESSIPGTEFKLNILKKDFNLSDDMGVLDYIERIVPVLKNLSPIEQDIYIKKLANEFNISENAILMAVQSDTENSRTKPKYISKKVLSSDSNSSDKYLKTELSLMALSMKNPKYFDRIKNEKIEFKTTLGLMLFETIDKYLQTNQVDSSGIDESVLLRNFDPDDEKVILKYLEKIKIGPDDQDFYDEIIKFYLLNKYKDKRIMLSNDLAVAEKIGEQEEMDKIAKEIIEIDNLIQNITGGENV